TRYPGRLEPDAERFGTHLEPPVPAGNGPDLPRLAATPAPAQRAAGIGARRARHRRGAKLWLRVAFGIYRCLSRTVRRHARRVLSRRTPGIPAGLTLPTSGAPPCPSAPTRPTRPSSASGCSSTPAPCGSVI